ncbi:response regulator transcription factor [Clostridium lacusfryxellense]|uniref:response regulator transcription factor n=1 Tax=Clostridium lacusfryxellense TaxID=205328 RepID=UPI001C0ACA10|nr:response regulator transcription factor [Clostridium lacusfryxellense]MBU3114561.1 response regulator transcription factor [Clostridium lacusfryxellense]
MKKVLIIEDELSIAELERDYLEINDFSVDIEVDGEMGLKAALNNNYNLIILDVMLPKFDGFEICRQIRNVKNVPILMVSAKKEDIDKIRGLGLGADDYVTKPFSPGELVARVKAHISRYERLIGENKNKNEIIGIRGLSIDCASRRVCVNGSEVILTAKEFDILKILAINPNKVFSKDNIFNKVWGVDSFGDVGTVTVHIRKLREKIEVDPSNPKYIETIWGVGYRFEL